MAEKSSREDALKADSDSLINQMNNNPKGSARPSRNFKNRINEKNKSKKLKTVTENRLFTRAYSKGSRAVSKSLAVYVLNGKGFRDIRYGITVSKDRGGAVVRNRLRRIIRAAYRELYPRLRRGCTIIIVARQGCVGKKSSELVKELEQMFSKTGLLTGPDDTAKTVSSPPSDGGKL
ncbi:MAG: ribonuclease P protein component [Eubacteriales bacterium]|nr:ribonuclease P protein component [Eubacteriales bacterium]